VLLSSRTASGDAFPVSNANAVIGSIKSYIVSYGESLHEVAVKAGLGYNEIVDANPGVDPWLPGEGTEVVIPKLWVLPEAPLEGIVINLAEMRLYHYTDTDAGKVVETYAVGIGTETSHTPLGKYQIREKLENPRWIVPESMRKKDAMLPREMPPGDENPLGKYALRLSDPQYLIHGTNRPFGIGRRVSHGCIRMYPEDIAKLYAAVKLGTPVRIVDQPIKAGIMDDIVYMEFHRPHNKGNNMWEEAASVLKKRGLLGMVDAALIRSAIEGRTGVPVPITAKENASPME
jgi:L,D-transpeptidase ErfK/SrfK